MVVLLFFSGNLKNYYSLLLTPSQNGNSVQQCYPLPDYVYCIEFKCETGEPQMTIGGSGACTDGSVPIVIKTWNE